MKALAIAFVKFYRYLVSPLIGNSCRFHPSCSNYCIESINKHGLFKGSAKSALRILKCNPFSKGGVDLP